MTDNNIYKLGLFETKIKEAENIIIIPHYNPDGDAIGSALGLYLTLIKFNPNVHIISPSLFPDFLKWMPGSKKIKVLGAKTKNSPNIFSNADLLIAVDLNSINRMGIASDRFNSSNAYKILIDHHPDPENFTDLTFSDTAYSSTAEFIFEILSNTFLKKYLDKDIATCLYAGIMTDTGSFNFNSSSPNTYITVAELLKLGINKDKIFDNVYNSFSEDRMRFLGHILRNRMVVFPKLKTAYMYVTTQDRKDFKEQFGDTENFVNMPLSIKGIIFSAIFIERDNFVKISFRSKGTFSVNDFSKKHFNGGGHTNASGGESYMSLQETTKNFVNILNEYEDILKNYEY